MKSKNKIVGNHLHIAFRDNSVMKPPFCENYLKLWCILNLLSIFDKKMKNASLSPFFVGFKRLCWYFFPDCHRTCFVFLLSLVSVLANIFINFSENRYLQLIVKKNWLLIIYFFFLKTLELCCSIFITSEV